MGMDGWTAFNGIALWRSRTITYLWLIYEDYQQDVQVRDKLNCQIHMIHKTSSPFTMELWKLCNTWKLALDLGIFSVKDVKGEWKSIK
jgi:hypothetical protein